MSSQDILNLHRLDADISESHINHRKFTSDDLRGIRRIERIEKWHRKESLGRGGTAQVFLEREEKGQLRAIKEIRKDHLPYRGYDYLREVLSMILSPEETYFPKFLGWFENDQKLFITMQYFPLGDLTKSVSGPLAEMDAKAIVIQLAEALEVLRTRQITHRDIKPENVFVCRASPQWWVKLGDFGISKRVQDDRTSLHTSVGSGCYIAPEVYGEDTSHTPYTSAVDMWSLGCVIFWLTAGRAPFSIWKQALREKPTVRRELQASTRLTPAGLDALQSCLDLQPDKRPQPAQLIRSEWLHTMSDASNQTQDRAITPVSEDRAITPDSEVLHIGFNLPDDSEQAVPTSLSADQQQSEEGRPVKFKHVDRASPLNRSAHQSDLDTTSKRVHSLGDSELANDWHTWFVETSTEARSLALTKVEALISQGYEFPFPFREDGQNALRFAAQHGMINLIEHLRSLGLRVDAKTNRDLIAIHYAAQGGHIATIDHLRSLGLDVKAKDNSGGTAIHYAAQGGHIATIDHLRSLGLDVKAKSSIGRTAIHYAAQGGHIATIDHLRSLGLDVKAKSNTGRTVIHYAAQGGHIATIDHLRSLGLDVKAKDNSGGTAIHYAAQGGHIATIDHLRSLGLDVEAKDKYGGIAIHHAAERGQIATINHLRSLGLDVEAKDKYGGIAIHHAAERGQIATIDHLRSLGLDVEAKDNNRWTAMQYAARGDQIATIDHLHSLGLDVGAKTKGGQTAIEIAKRFDQQKASDYIKTLMKSEKKSQRRGFRSIFSS